MSNEDNGLERLLNPNSWSENEFDEVFEALEGTYEFNEEECCRIIQDYIKGSKGIRQRAGSYFFTLGASALAGVISYPMYWDTNVPFWVGGLATLTIGNFAYLTNWLRQSISAGRAEKIILIALSNREGKGTMKTPSFPRGWGLDCREYRGENL